MIANMNNHERDVFLPSEFLFNVTLRFSANIST